jgi:hypothetical protein
MKTKVSMFLSQEHSVKFKVLAAQAGMDRSALLEKMLDMVEVTPISLPKIQIKGGVV